jgi:hypothetical protein
MGLVAVSLAVFASLHLAGVLAGGSKPFRPDDAGIAVAITAFVLAYGPWLSCARWDVHTKLPSEPPASPS